MNWSWSYAATVYEREYGVYVDWEEGFFNCPGCGEPLLLEDWEHHCWEFCPICDFNFFDE